jgi:hypothetical protein
MTRNGKIARLPQSIQDKLNRRLDDHEPGKKLVIWLNSLPEVQAVLAANFNRQPIREQNLSEWKQGGYRDWQQRQERRELFQQLRAEAGDLTAVMNEADFNRQFSLLLKTNLALAVRDIMENETEPAKRASALAGLAGKYAQLRREESNAARVKTICEKWENEQALAKSLQDSCNSLFPDQALLLQRLYLDSLGQKQPWPQPIRENHAAGLFSSIHLPSTRQTNPGESD